MRGNLLDDNSKPFFNEIIWILKNFSLSIIFQIIGLMNFCHRFSSFDAYKNTSERLLVLIYFQRVWMLTKTAYNVLRNKFISHCS